MIDKLLNRLNILKAFKTFPLSSVLAIFTTTVLLYIIEYHDNNLLIRLLMSGYLSFLTAIGAELFIKSRQDVKRNLIAYAIPMLTFISWYIYMPAELLEIEDYLSKIIIYRFLAAVIVLHLIISFIPYTSQYTEEDFWEYNKNIFLRIFESALFAGVLFVGLSLAIVALEKLFGFDIDGDWYARLLAFLGGIFMSLYFLSKFPSLENDGQVKAPNNAYKVFTEYILIYIVTIYLLLLYAFAGKIIAQGTLPKGWITYLTLCFSIVGIFTWLLNYFNVQFSTLKYTAFYKKYFFLLLCLPVFMLLIAIWVRLKEYGLTENRYIVSTLATWLTILVILFGILRRGQLRYIPITLALLTIIAAFGGPLDMFSSSIRNQSKSLKGLLEQNGILSNNNLILKEDLEIAAQSKIVSKIKAIDGLSNLSHIDNWFDIPLLDGYVDSIDYNKGSYLIKKLGLSETSVLHDKKGTTYFNLDINQNPSMDISGYNSMSQFYLYNSGENRANQEESSIVIINNHEVQLNGYYNYALDTIIRTNWNTHNRNPISSEKLQFIMKSDSFSDIKIFLQHLHGQIKKDDIIVEGGGGFILKQ